ncbi:hypothetical protein WN51_01254 [Melipona quadrifasciata]|uniref:Uncharacterized protein n=1 Tax=Melipona quadrifasciata TaxID=166423 RepID=A0A0M8ZZF7_9HYME|nr:hypothetical protein WN51_01254 [Melipona quadrifasciata]
MGQLRERHSTAISEREFNVYCTVTCFTPSLERMRLCWTERVKWKREKRSSRSKVSPSVFTQRASINRERRSRCDRKNVFVPLKMENVTCYLNFRPSAFTV